VEASVRQVAKTTADKLPVGVLTRVFAIIGALVEASPKSLSTLARETRLPLSTTLRLLGSLEEFGAVSRDRSGNYHLGTRMIEIGFRALEDVAPIEAAHPHLQTLAVASGESANLAIRVDEDAVYVDHAQSDRAIRHVNWLGRRVPLSTTAIGAALLGRLNGDGFAYTQKTLEHDVTAIAAPVVGSAGVTVCALSVTGPSYRLSGERIDEVGNLVARTAGELAGVLGVIRFSAYAESWMRGQRAAPNEEIRE